MEKLTNYEITMRIYDTLFNNKEYPQFNPNSAEMCEVNANDGFIEFYIGDRHYFLQLTEEKE